MKIYLLDFMVLMSILTSGFIGIRYIIISVHQRWKIEELEEQLQKLKGI